MWGRELAKDQERIFEQFSVQNGAFITAGGWNPWAERSALRL